MISLIDMDKLIISQRLKAVANMVRLHGCVADVGCDHGYLSIYMVLNNICSRAIATDLRKAPLGKAEANIKEYGLLQNIETRLSDGLQKLRKDEAGTLCIAGMGGPLIIKILEKGKPWELGVKELVISPQSEIFKVREYLCNNGYLVDEENMVWDEGKYYNILHVVQGVESHKTRVQLMYGECLLKEQNPVLKQYLYAQKEKCEHVIRKISERSDSDAVKARLPMLQSEISLIKEALSRYEM